MVQTIEAPQTKERTLYTHRLKRDYGYLVVDEWEAANPSGELPVMLIHGWGGSGTYWRNTAIALSETVRVIVPDLPGTGRSQPMTKIHNMFDQVNVLIDIMHTLDIDRVQVVGHSMGGAMALVLDSCYPEHIDRIVLTSLTFFKTERQKKIYGNVMQGLKLSLKLRAKWMSSIPGGAQLMAKQYFYRVPKDNPLLQAGLKDFLELHLDTAVACANDVTHPSIPNAGAELNIPVLLIACRQDNMMPVENVDYTKNIIPNCQVQWIEECGHIPMVEKPDEFLALLRKFLQLGR